MKRHGHGDAIHGVDPRVQYSSLSFDLRRLGETTCDIWLGYCMLRLTLRHILRNVTICQLLTSFWKERSRVYSISFCGGIAIIDDVGCDFLCLHLGDGMLVLRVRAEWASLSWS